MTRVRVDTTPAASTLYNWIVGRAYRLRVWATGTDSLGEWYTGWVQDTVTGTERLIGSLRVPFHGARISGGDMSWTERIPFTDLATCSGTGGSKVQWNFPTANGGSVAISGHSTISSGDCPAYTRILHVPGADVQEIGRTLPAAPNLNFASYLAVGPGSRSRARRVSPPF